MFSGIQNYYEHLVFDYILEVVDSTDEEYLEDLACVSLNSLPSRYIRYPIDLAVRLDYEDRDQLERQVENAVKAAIKLIDGRRSERE